VLHEVLTDGGIGTTCASLRHATVEPSLGGKTIEGVLIV
jgi:hypothetical protein